MEISSELVERCAEAAWEVSNAYEAAVIGSGRAHWDQIIGGGHALYREMARRILEDERIVPSGVHQHWCNYMLSHGWKHGTVQDEDQKIHPCLKEYTKLTLVAQNVFVLILVAVRAVRETWKNNLPPRKSVAVVCDGDDQLCEKCQLELVKLGAAPFVVATRPTGRWPDNGTRDEVVRSLLDVAEAVLLLESLGTPGELVEYRDFVDTVAKVPCFSEAAGPSPIPDELRAWLKADDAVPSD